MPVIGALLTLLSSFFGGFFKTVGNYTKLVFDFLKEVVPKVLRWGFLLSLLFFSSALIVFTIYHVVYGSAIGLSSIVTTKTINIIIYSSYGLFIYFVYLFLFKR